MKVDRDRFLEEGYLILRNVIPPDRLEALRESHELMVDRQRVIWAQNRGPDDPPGGAWETAGQPRLHLQGMRKQIDERTVETLELWQHENLQGVSSELMGVEDAGVTEMMMMCNPVSDRGPARWHRDYHPLNWAPVEGYADDIIENGPRYVQWNIPLYDDDVLWVVPGSHSRITTKEEDEQLTRDVRAPLDGGVQTHLNGGDGVVYILPILHWGSNYSTKKRRTVHGGFSEFTIDFGMSEWNHVSTAAADIFDRWESRSRKKIDQAEAALRAAMGGDRDLFRQRLNELHRVRGPKGTLMSTILLSKAARGINNLKRPDFNELPDWERNCAVADHPMTFQWGRAIADRFTSEEANSLWARFKPLDDRLLGDEERTAPGFQGSQSKYEFNRMPADLTLDGFVDGW